MQQFKGKKHDENEHFSIFMENVQWITKRTKELPQNSLMCLQCKNVCFANSRTHTNSNKTFITTENKCKQLKMEKCVIFMKQIA